VTPRTAIKQRTQAPMKEAQSAAPPAQNPESRVGLARRGVRLGAGQTAGLWGRTTAHADAHRALSRGENGRPHHGLRCPDKEEVPPRGACHKRATTSWQQRGITGKKQSRRCPIPIYTWRNAAAAHLPSWWCEFDSRHPLHNNRRQRGRTSSWAHGWT
jgi:hypothetical protein